MGSVVGLCLYSQLVNLIFLLGQAVEYNWGMWLQICLVLSALLSHYVRPYELTSDNRQEQMSFLGLSLVLTVTNSGVRYAGAWKWYHISVVAFVILVSTASMVCVLVAASFSSTFGDTGLTQSLTVVHRCGFSGELRRRNQHEKHVSSAPRKI